MYVFFNVLNYFDLLLYDATFFANKFIVYDQMVEKIEKLGTSCRFGNKHDRKDFALHLLSKSDWVSVIRVFIFLKSIIEN